MQTAVMGITFVLTLAIPMQYAVLVGVALSMLLYVVRQSNQLDVRRLVVNERGKLEEVDPPEEVPTHEVVMVQPYGSLFFAATDSLDEQMPTVTDESVGSVVIIRLRGKNDVGSTFIDGLGTYTESLRSVGSKLVVVTDSDRILEQLRATDVADLIGEENRYRSTRELLTTVSQAAADANEWVVEQDTESDRTGPDSPALPDEEAGELAEALDTDDGDVSPDRSEPEGDREGDDGTGDDAG